MKKDQIIKTLGATTGKDLLSLPGAVDNSPFEQQDHTPPRNPQEQIIFGIWTTILRHDRFGIGTDFFSIGGNSLKATRIISRISAIFSVEIGLQEIFSYPTIAGLAKHITALDTTLPQTVLIRKGTAAGKIPLSFEQDRLWFIDNLAGTIQYHIPAVWRIKGKVDIAALQSALCTIVGRHESLRTIYGQDNGQAWQEVIPADAWQLTVVDDPSLGENKDALHQYIKNRITRPFDLSKDYMLRAFLIPLGKNECILSVIMHHIAADGWSLAILFRELREYYAAFTDRSDPHLPALPLQYTDYAIWQKQRLTGEVLAAKIAFWQDHLKDLQPLDLPADYPRPGVQSVKGSIRTFMVEKDLADRIVHLCRQQGVTLFMGLLAAFKILLHRYSGQKDICVGSPVAGRQQQEWQTLIGFFVNMLPLRSDLGGDPPFTDFLQQIRNTTLRAYAHQDTPFGKIVEAVVKVRQPSMSPLFQVSFVLQENMDDLPAEGRPDGIDLTEEPIEHTTSLFDLKLSLTERNEGLTGNIEYCTDLYSADRIERMIGHYIRLLQSIAEDPSAKIGQLTMLTDGEQRQLLHEFSSGAAATPEKTTVIHLLEEQAARRPDAIALISDGQTMTYAALDQRSRKLADYLEQKGLRAEQLVPVCLDRGPDMIVSFLGIMRAGGAFVPIDPGYPTARIAAILSDTDSTLMISNTFLRHTLLAATEKKEWTVVELDGHASEIERAPARKDRPMPSSEHLAYVIFTSGSTGSPKGVLIEHGSLLNYVLNSNTSYATEDTNTSAGSYMYLPCTFDASLTAIFSPLITGRSIVIGSNTTIEAFENPAFWQHAPYEFIKITPLHIPMLETAAKDRGWPRMTDRLVIGGEALLISHLQGLIAAGQDIEVINEYGPTETTVGCTTWRFRTMTAPHTWKNNLPIGRPIDNTFVFIADKYGNVVPIGIPGGLYVGGKGLARGYLNRPDLTAECFIPNPFLPDTGSRLYKTGDAARWLPDGNMEFIGRMDDQVKVRGYRIEPGETEQALLDSKMVTAAIVLAKRDARGDNRLIAYVIPGPGYDQQTVLAHLHTVLPDYQVPSILVPVDIFPLTAHGKTDKEKLPDPFSSVRQPGEKFLPRNEAEKELLEIWSDILDLPASQIGIDHNFFEAGGDSLKSIQLARSINNKWQKNISVAELFQYTTIRTIVEYLSPAPGKRKEMIPEDPQQRVGPPASSPAAATDDTAIAIIGISGQFPFSEDPHRFWENLAAGKELTQEFSAEELSASGVPEEWLADPSYVRSGTVLEGKEYFDHAFFDYRPEEAALIDPQTRLFHQHCWKTLEDAGYASGMDRRQVALFAAASENDNWKMYAYSMEDRSSVDPYYLRCISSHRYISSLVAYKLNIKGPVVFLDTACSSSLVAVHSACSSLLAGECTMALAGGVSLITRKEKGYRFREGIVLSPDGRCRTFDKEAAGTFPGQGIGVVLLKKLAAAIADNDNIYAVIRSTAVNNDGSSKVGFTAPGIKGQADCIRMAHRQAGIDVHSIGYVEAHGTGTKLGDPVEIRALNEAFGVKGPERSCAIGSVKSNMGHLDAAAGIAGLIKTTLSLQNKKILPSIHFTSANPEIDFKGGVFYVNTELKDWPRQGNAPLRAGLSSFGIGGTNAHVILEEAPTSPTPLQKGTMAPGDGLLLISAKSPASLNSYREALIRFISGDKTPELADMSYTLQVGRTHFACRQPLLFKDRTDLLTKLNASKPAAIADRSRDRKIIFMFPGQGTQYHDMGKDLYTGQPAFRNEMDKGFSHLQKWTGKDFKKILFDTTAGSRTIDETANTQPILFLFEYALARQLMEWGITPDYMIGHSVGEYVAACLSGVFTFEDALRLVMRRGQLMNSLPAGAMITVPLTEENAHGYLDDQLSLAAINAPEQVVFSGTSEKIDRLMTRLGKDGIAAIRLHTSHAFHSAMLDPVLTGFKEEFKDLPCQAPAIPFVSNLTARLISDEEAASADYWAGHMRQTVRFSAGIATLQNLPGSPVFIELGPGHALSSLLKQHRRGPEKTTGHPHGETTKRNSQ